MTFEKQFPSLKVQTWKKGERLFGQSQIMDYCLDKGRTFNLSEDEMHDLIVKGNITTQFGLNLTALYPTNFGDLGKYLKAEHILLEEYKARVKQAIDKVFPEEKHLSQEMLAKKELLQELGL